MSSWERICFIFLPMLGILGHYLGVWFVPDTYHRIFFSEQGVIELGTATFYAMAACVALTLSFKTRGLVSKGYRIFYGFFALTALFIALEEISYGQHLFGWETPQWFAEHNIQQEINLHNLFGDRPADVLSDLAFFVFPIGCIILPGLVMLRHGGYTPAHWPYYLLPRGELITVVTVAVLLGVMRKLPSSVFALHKRGLSEVIEFYWGAAVLLYVIVMWRRLVLPNWEFRHKVPS